MPYTPAPEPLAAGANLSHYRILERLGGGGAGVVYRALDTELGRSVALKFLSVHLEHHQESRERFVQEARAASALDHPNICTIFEIGEADDQRMFIAMACYDGETLESRIRRGPMPVDDVLDFAAQAARGLAKAHRKSIIHRDIKPANLFVTDDGVVKILDFGIAKVGDHRLTQTGSSVGTITYMSPEQLSGEPLDHTTDHWSLGVVIHEMLSGKSLFGAGSQWNVMSGIMTQVPPRVSTLRADCPGSLSDLVAKCLAPRPEDRFQSTDQLVTELEAIGHPQTGPVTTVAAAARAPAGPIGIVVKPFEDISPDRDNEYFSDGLTEEVITDLSRIKALRVISRGSAMMLKNTARSVKDIGRELGVRYVLEGAVRKQGDRLRITARLIEAETEGQVWAEKFSGTLQDIFDIQERVAFSIVAALKVEVTPIEKRNLIARPIENAAAFECHLRSRQELWRMTPDSINRAEVLLRQGLAIVGENALLRSGLGQVCWQRVNLGIRPEESLTEAAAHAKAALDLDPQCPQAEQLLSLVVGSRGDMIGAVGHLRRALAVDPGNADALGALVLFFGYLGKTAEALPLVERLVSLDPLTPVHQATMAWVHFVDGRFAMAAEGYGELHRSAPTNPIYAFSYAQALACSGATNAAVAVLEQIELGGPETLTAKAGRVLRFALRGDKPATLEAVTPQVEAFARQAMYASWILADCYALIGEVDSSLASLENAANLGFINYPFLSRFDPLLARLRGEERFQQLMERVKQRWEQCEV